MNEISYAEILNIYKKIGMSSKALGETNPITSEFKETGGIYGWVVNGIIVYVGKTENFNKRFKTHVDELIKQKSRTGKYNHGIAPQEVDIIILFETENPTSELLSIVEQLTIDACGGISNLLNDRNEATYFRVMKKIKRD